MSAHDEAQRREEELAERRSADREASEALTRRVAAVAEEKGATELVALDVRDLVGYTDFLLICTARNERQAKAIHDEVYAKLKREDGRLPASVEGEREARWILLDYFDCVLHVFVPDLREHYRLERLWGEAPKLELAAPSDQ
jgi:ribosome-associated protein